jgi:hypothetical protein
MAGGVGGRLLYYRILQGTKRTLHRYKQKNGVSNSQTFGDNTSGDKTRKRRHDAHVVVQSYKGKRGYKA